VLRLSALQLRIATGLVFLAGLSLTVYWVLARRGPYPKLLELELGDSPATHPLAAALSTFIVTTVPGLLLVLVLAWFSPVREKIHPRNLPAAYAEYQEAMEGRGKHRESMRAARNFGIAAGGGVVGACIRSGWFEAWFGDPGSMTAAILVALAFGLVAGVIHGRRPLARIGFAFALAGVSLGALPAVAWYLELRPEPLLIELLLPIFVGALPGTLVFWGCAKWIERP